MNLRGKKKVKFDDNDKIEHPADDDSPRPASYSAGEPSQARATLTFIEKPIDGGPAPRSIRPNVEFSDSVVKPAPESKTFITVKHLKAKDIEVKIEVNTRELYESVDYLADLTRKMVVGPPALDKYRYDVIKSELTEINHMTIKSIAKGEELNPYKINTFGRRLENAEKEILDIIIQWLKYYSYVLLVAIKQCHALLSKLHELEKLKARNKELEANIIEFLSLALAQKNNIYKLLIEPIDLLPSVNSTKDVLERVELLESRLHKPLPVCFPDPPKPQPTQKEKKKQVKDKKKKKDDKDKKKKKDDQDKKKKKDDKDKKDREDKGPDKGSDGKSKGGSQQDSDADKSKKSKTGKEDSKGEKEKKTEKKEKKDQDKGKKKKKDASDKEIDRDPKLTVHMGGSGVNDNYDNEQKQKGHALKKRLQQKWQRDKRNIQDEEKVDSHQGDDESKTADRKLEETAVSYRTDHYVYTVDHRGSDMKSRASVNLQDTEDSELKDRTDQAEEETRRTVPLFEQVYQERFPRPQSRLWRSRASRDTGRSTVKKDYKRKRDGKFEFPLRKKRKHELPNKHSEDERIEEDTRSKEEQSAAAGAGTAPTERHHMAELYEVVLAERHVKAQASERRVLDGERSHADKASEFLASDTQQMMEQPQQSRSKRTKLATSPTKRSRRRIARDGAKKNKEVKETVPIKSDGVLGSLVRVTDKQPSLSTAKPRERKPRKLGTKDEHSSDVISKHKSGTQLQKLLRTLKPKQVRKAKEEEKLKSDTPSERVNKLKQVGKEKTSTHDRKVEGIVPFESGKPSGSLTGAEPSGRDRGIHDGELEETTTKKSVRPFGSLIRRADKKPVPKTDKPEDSKPSRKLGTKDEYSDLISQQKSITQFQKFVRTLKPKKFRKVNDVQEISQMKSDAPLEGETKPQQIVKGEQDEELGETVQIKLGRTLGSLIRVTDKKPTVRTDEPKDSKPSRKRGKKDGYSANSQQKSVTQFQKFVRTLQPKKFKKADVQETPQPDKETQDEKVEIIPLQPFGSLIRAPEHKHARERAMQEKDMGTIQLKPDKQFGSLLRVTEKKPSTADGKLRRRLRGKPEYSDVTKLQKLFEFFKPKKKKVKMKQEESVQESSHQKSGSGLLEVGKPKLMRRDKDKDGKEIIDKAARSRELMKKSRVVKSPSELRCSHINLQTIQNIMNKDEQETDLTHQKVLKSKDQSKKVPAKKRPEIKENKPIGDFVDVNRTKRIGRDKWRPVGNLKPVTKRKPVATTDKSEEDQVKIKAGKGKSKKFKGEVKPVTKCDHCQCAMDKKSGQVIDASTSVSDGAIIKEEKAKHDENKSKEKFSEPSDTQVFRRQMEEAEGEGNMSQVDETERGKKEKKFDSSSRIKRSIPLRRLLKPIKKKKKGGVTEKPNGETDQDKISESRTGKQEMEEGKVHPDKLEESREEKPKKNEEVKRKAIKKPLLRRGMPVALLKKSRPDMKRGQEEMLGRKEASQSSKEAIKTEKIETEMLSTLKNVRKKKPVIPRAMFSRAKEKADLVKEKDKLGMSKEKLVIPKKERKVPDIKKRKPVPPQKEKKVKDIAKETPVTPIKEKKVKDISKDKPVTPKKEKKVKDIPKEKPVTPKKEKKGKDIAKEIPVTPIKEKKVKDISKDKPVTPKKEKKVKDIPKEKPVTPKKEKKVKDILEEKPVSLKKERRVPDIKKKPVPPQKEKNVQAIPKSRPLSAKKKEKVEDILEEKPSTPKKEKKVKDIFKLKPVTPKKEKKVKDVLEEKPETPIKENLLEEKQVTPRKERKVPDIKKKKPQTPIKEKKVKDMMEKKAVTPKKERKVPDIKKRKPQTPIKEKKVKDMLEEKPVTLKEERKEPDIKKRKPLTPKTEKKIKDILKEKPVTPKKEKKVKDIQQEKPVTLKKEKKVKDITKEKPVTPKTVGQKRDDQKSDRKMFRRAKKDEEIKTKTKEDLSKLSDRLLRGEIIDKKKRKVKEDKKLRKPKGRSKREIKDEKRKAFSETKRHAGDEEPIKSESWEDLHILAEGNKKQRDRDFLKKSSARSSGKKVLPKGVQRQVVFKGTEKDKLRKKPIESTTPQSTQTRPRPVAVRIVNTNRDATRPVHARGGRVISRPTRSVRREVAEDVQPGPSGLNRSNEARKEDNKQDKSKDSSDEDSDD